MTYKEKVKEFEPESVTDASYGGVIGCPDEYFKFPLYGPCDGLNCEECWNRDYRGEEIIK